MRRARRGHTEEAGDAFLNKAVNGRANERLGIISEGLGVDDVVNMSRKRSLGDTSQGAPGRGVRDLRAVPIDV